MLLPICWTCKSAAVSNMFAMSKDNDMSILSSQLVSLKLPKRISLCSFYVLLFADLVLKVCLNGARGILFHCVLTRLKSLCGEKAERHSGKWGEPVFPLKAEEERQEEGRERWFSAVSAVRRCLALRRRSHCEVLWFFMEKLRCFIRHYHHEQTFKGD